MAIVPLIVSVVALLLSAAFGLVAARDRRLDARLSRERDLRSWAREIHDTYVALMSADVEERQTAWRRLAALIDFGRLFFPNDRNKFDLVDVNKGYRSSILDPLVESAFRCGKNDWNHGRFHEDRRRFVDELCQRTTAFGVATSPESKRKPQYRNR